MKRQSSGRSRAGTRPHPRRRELYIERTISWKNRPKKFFPALAGYRSAAAYAHFIKCTDANQERGRQVVELRCTTIRNPRRHRRTGARSRRPCTGFRPRGPSAEIRIYNPCSQSQPGRRQFRRRSPSAIARNSGDARIEPRSRRQVRNDVMPVRGQGYFVRIRTRRGSTVFNRSIGLRDTFAKEVGGKVAGRSRRWYAPSLREKRAIHSFLGDR